MKTIQFETLEKGFYCNIKSQENHLVKDKVKWQNLWHRIHDNIVLPPKTPYIDFKKEMVIAVFIGFHPTGGYNVEIKEIVEIDDSVVVNVVLTTPPKGSCVTMSTTSPYHIVKCKKSSKMMFKVVEF
jgi:hypothetical protein